MVTRKAAVRRSATDVVHGALSGLDTSFQRVSRGLGPHRPEENIPNLVDAGSGAQGTSNIEFVIVKEA